MSSRFDAVVVGAGPPAASPRWCWPAPVPGWRWPTRRPSRATRHAGPGGPRGCRFWRISGCVSPTPGRALTCSRSALPAERLPAFTGRTYPGHGIIVPRLALDHALREAALQAGAVPVRARITAVEAGGDGRVDAVVSSDGQRLAGEVIIAADGALSPVARLAGMLDPRRRCGVSRSARMCRPRFRCRCWSCSTPARGVSTPGTAGCFPVRMARRTWASASASAAAAGRHRCGAI